MPAHISRDAHGQVLEEAPVQPKPAQNPWNIVQRSVNNAPLLHEHSIGLLSQAISLNTIFCFGAHLGAEVMDWLCNLQHRNGITPRSSYALLTTGDGVFAPNGVCNMPFGGLQSTAGVSGRVASSSIVSCAGQRYAWTMHVTWASTKHARVYCCLFTEHMASWPGLLIDSFE